jgi:hypothetical protein
MELGSVLALESLTVILPGNYRDRGLIVQQPYAPEDNGSRRLPGGREWDCLPGSRSTLPQQC